MRICLACNQEIKVDFCQNTECKNYVQREFKRFHLMVCESLGISQDPVNWKNDLAKVALAISEQRRTLEGAQNNVSCGACAEGIFTGAVNSAHQHTCGREKVEALLVVNSQQQHALSEICTHLEAIEDALKECHETSINPDEKTYWQHELEAHQANIKLIETAVLLKTSNVWKKILDTVITTLDTNSKYLGFVAIGHPPDNLKPNDYARLSLLTAQLKEELQNSLKG